MNISSVGICRWSIRRCHSDSTTSRTRGQRSCLLRKFFEFEDCVHGQTEHKSMKYIILTFHALYSVDYKWNIYQLDSTDSIQKRTESFVFGLQEEFPSTVSTIFRVGDKMGSSSSDKSQQHLKKKSSCVLCSVSKNFNQWRKYIRILTPVASGTTRCPRSIVIRQTLAKWRTVY